LPGIAVLPEMLGMNGISGMPGKAEFLGMTVMHVMPRMHGVPQMT